jgi:glycosyltransferase involved in cell wall biosynthesis
MTAKKAPMELLAAYAISGRAGNSALIMVGAGELLDEARAYATSHALPKVVFTGFVNQSAMPKFYAISDVFVRPDGLYQGDWGLTVNEAMAAGLAVIASDRIGATTDLVGQDDNGIVIRFGDGEALARAIRDCIAQPGMVLQMGLRSRERIQEWSYTEGVTGTVEAVQRFGRRHRIAADVVA